MKVKYTVTTEFVCEIDDGEYKLVEDVIAKLAYDSYHTGVVKKINTVIEPIDNNLLVGR